MKYTLGDNAPSVLREDLQESNIIFVHSRLDEAGLTPAEFRIYCHLSRVGTCFQKGATIAKTCRVHPDTVWAALKELEVRGMIRRRSNAGFTTEITLTKPSEWKAPTDPPESEGRPSDSGGGHRKIRGTHPPENKGHKGNPTEVHPIKEIPMETPNRIEDVAEMHQTFCRQSGKEYNQMSNERIWLTLLAHGYVAEDVGVAVRYVKFLNSQQEDTRFHRAITPASICGDPARFDSFLVDGRGWDRNRRQPPTPRETALEQLRPTVDPELAKARLKPAQSAGEVLGRILRQQP